MSDDTKDRDPSHETMPPELRPFAKPEPPQRLVAPQNEAKFNAAIGALRILNGGPQADPFYVDAKHDPALAERKAPESVTAYVPPTAVPSSEAKARRAAPARVVIAEASEAASAPVATGDDAEARGEKTQDESAKPPETPASPWSKEAPTSEPVRASALPSSLRPREPHATEGAAPASTRPASELPAGAPSPGRAKIRAAIGIAILVVAAAIGARALTTGRTPENAAHGPVPTATMTVPATPLPVPSAESSAAPSPSGASSASAAVPVPPPSTEPVPTTPHPIGKRVQPRGEDPYADAAAPPAKTAGPRVPPPATAAPSVTPPTTAQPAVTPKAPATASSAHPPSGPILGGTE